MRKAISILLAFLVLITTIHFSIATHYCGGEVAAVKFSLTGEKATCGMEEDTKSCPLSNSVRSHCCSDHLTIVAADQDNISFSSIQKNPEQKVSEIFTISLTEIIRNINLTNLFENLSGLQNVFRTGQSLLTRLCVFRI